MTILAEKKYTRLLVIAIVGGTQFVLPFLASAVNIILPDLQKELHATALQLSLVSAVYLLGINVFILPMGRLSDIFGRKKVFMSGTVIMGLSSLLLIHAGDIRIFLVFRFLQGLGAAMVVTTGLVIAFETFPKNERARAISIIVAAIYIGMSIGPFIGGVLTGLFGYRSIFYCVVALMLFFFFGAFFGIKEQWQKTEKVRFDYKGAVLYGLAVSSFMFMISGLFKNSFQFILLLFASVLFIVLFIRAEKKSTNPLLPVDLFVKNKQFLYSCLLIFTNFMASFCVPFYLALYLQYILKFSESQAGLVLIIPPAMQVLLSFWVGNQLDKKVEKPFATYGVILMTTGLFLLACIIYIQNFWFIALALVFIGVGIAFFVTPSTMLLMECVGEELHSVGSSVNSVMRSFGMMFCMSIISAIFRTVLGNKDVATDNYHLFLVSMQTGFIVFFVVGLLSIGISFLAYSAKAKREKEQAQFENANG